MYADLKRFLGHSVIYFIGNVLNRLGIFVLLPLYTNYLTPGEYGALELVFVTISCLKVFLGMRLGHATLRFFFEYETEEDRKKLTSSSMISIISWAFCLIIFFSFLSGHLSLLIFKETGYRNLLLLGFALMFFEVTAEIPIAFLRAKEYSLLYVITSLLQLLLRVGLNIYIVISLHGGISGILAGNLISAIVFWLCLCVITFRYSGFRFDFSKIKDITKYSYPLVIASLPDLFLRNMDRIFLMWYASLEAVGLYALAIRFGMALRNFILEPFQLNYGPFRFSIMKQENAREIYSRMFTYFLFLVTFTGLFMALLSREVIELMASKSFREAYRIVPIIIMATIIGGLNYIFQTGLLIEKRTSYMPYISLTIAVLNAVFLFILVPYLGIYGAGLSLLLNAIIEMILTYRFSQNLYFVSFEYERIIKIIGVALLIYFVSMFTNGLNIYERLFIKPIIIITFPLLLALLRFYREEEIGRLNAFRERVGMKVLSAVGINRR